MKSTNIANVTLLKIGLLFRVFLLFSTPFLSQDFYRFIWDGRLIFNGINPYQFLPIDLIKNPEVINQSEFLLAKMGDLSANHYSNYPPLNQLLFLIAAVISSKSIFGSIVVFKIIIILSDIGIYHFGRKILTILNRNPKAIFWYFLNPLVLIELSGNLHFEGVMLFFLLAGIWYFNYNKLAIAALLIGFSISIKLLPLLLLPLFWQQIGIKKSSVFYFIVILINVLLFVPFVNQSLFQNYSETIGLWFTNFEFNASIYYLVRQVGYEITGYNVIGIVGKFIPVLTLICILYFAFLKKIVTLASLFFYATVTLGIYLLISTTVHPWYVINLILLGIFTNLKFPIVWSFTIIMSYYAYSVFPFQENRWLLLAEYLAVFGTIIYDILLNKKTKNLILNN